MSRWVRGLLAGALVLLGCALVLIKAEAGGRGGYGRGGYVTGSPGSQSVTVWGMSTVGPGGFSWWGVYRFGGGVPLTEPLPPPATYWLYCQDTQQYYPYVRDCTRGWQKVEPPARR